MDEPTNEPVIEPEVVETPPDVQSEPVVEPEPVTPPEEEVVPESVVPEPEALDPETPPSRRELKRIDQILAKREASSAPSQSKRQDALDYSELDADPEIKKLLEDDRRAAEAAQYSAGLQQANTLQWNTRLEIDAPLIESKYKFLDANDKESYDPVRANAMIRLYLNHVGYSPPDPEKGVQESVVNPHVRYRDFVEAQMEFAEALMADRNSTTTKNVVKQAAQTGLRPDGSSAKRLNLDRDPSEMTMEELYAAIGQKPPTTTK